MNGKLIRLEPHDDPASVRALLAHANSTHVILLPHPPALFATRAQAEWTQLLTWDRLRRIATTLGMRLAVVSWHPLVRGAASEAGLPVFWSEASARSGNWPASDTFAPVKRLVGPRRFALNGLRRFFPKPNPFGFALRAVLALASVLTLAGLAVFVLPSAKVSLTGATRSISTIVPVSLDTRVAVLDVAGRVVPAVRVESFIEGAIKIPTTGKADRARGTARGGVTFFNKSAQPYRVPRGTTVSTSGLSTQARFITENDVTVAPGASADAGVRALQDGAAFNVPANSVNVVEGAPSIAVSVINVNPIGGAGGETVNAVNNDDQRRARSALLTELTKKAADSLQLEPIVKRDSLYVVPASIIVREISNESFDKFIGEPAELLTLDLRIQVVGLAVNPNNLNTIARTALLKKVPASFELTDYEVDRGDEAEEGTGDRSEYFINARGRIQSQINPLEVRNLVRGKTVPEAENLLQNKYSLLGKPVITIGPSWLTDRLPRLPYAQVRIDTEIVATE